MFYLAFPRRIWFASLTKLTQPKVIDAFVSLNEQLAAFLAQGPGMECNPVRRNSSAPDDRAPGPLTQTESQRNLMKRNDPSARVYSRFSTLLIVAVGAAIFSLGAGLPQASAAVFPSRADGDDVMTSMGVIRVVVSPSFRFLTAPSAVLNGYPGYQPADGRLTSPLLFDTNTIVGRSDPYNRPLVGSRSVGLPSMGLQGISDYPLTPPLFSGMPAGTHELLTRIRNLGLRTSSQSCAQDPRVPFVPINHRMVYGGPDQGVARPSIGMVQRRSDAPAGNDFPAQSFFDIFVEIDLPPAPMTMSAGTFPSGGAVLYNRAPLLLQNTNLESLPPQVIYMQGETP